LVHDLRRFRPVLECSAARIPEVAQLLVGIERADRQIELSVVVEVLKDRAPGLIEAVDPRGVSHVGKRADLELATVPLVQLEQKSRIDLLGILAQRHVRQIQQPAGFQIIGEPLEVFREVLNG
jgi:hypothetical protein